MNDIPRYAIYYAPPPTHPLWLLGSEWLGRDAYSGETVKRREIDGFKSEDIDRLTSPPAKYGFHATMKAPFELKDGCNEDELIAALEAYCAQMHPFAVNPRVDALGEFIALRLSKPSKAMQDLHKDCVTHFDAFREPLSQTDIERRRKAVLSAEQDARMLEWGYPYIFEDFRWHMTLTKRIMANATRERVLQILTDMFAPALASALQIDGLAVYRQVCRKAPFTLLHRSTFKSPVGQNS